MTKEGAMQPAKNNKKTSGTPQKSLEIDRAIKTELRSWNNTLKRSSKMSKDGIYQTIRCFFITFNRIQ